MSKKDAAMLESLRKRCVDIYAHWDAGIEMKISGETARDMEQACLVVDDIITLIGLEYEDLAADITARVKEIAVDDEGSKGA
jgi:hypothetical protein